MADDVIRIRDYTDAFVVRKSIRKFGKIHVPLREGVLVSDLKVFGATLVVWFLAYGLILNSLLSTALRLAGLGGGISGLPYLFLLFSPPLVAAGVSRRPLRHNLTLGGLLRTSARHLLDDPVHRRGVPVRKAPRSRGHRISVWRGDPAVLPLCAADLPDLAAVQRASRVAGSPART